MEGFDIVLEKKVDSDVIKKIFSSVFHTSSSLIAVENDYSNMPNMDKMAIWINSNDVKGEFLQHLSVDILDRQLDNNSVLIAKKISRTLNMRCLLPTHELNPFTWIMFNPNKKIEKVSLNPDENDEDVYKLL